MFADLVGSTSLAERLEAERYGEVVRTYQAFVTEVVNARGGTVAQYLGDGLLIYFGYPLAQEDDVARAVHTGLELVQGIARLNAELADVALQIRVSIHTGDVVIADVGDHRERLAIGMTVNIASRLNEHTSIDSVAVSDATRRLVARQFEFEPLGALQLKGVAEALVAHHVLRERPSAAFDARPGRETRLIGRGGEIDQLSDSFRRAKRLERQVVCVWGEPGIGKTRLLQAFRELLSDRDDHLWLEGRCSPRRMSSALYPVEQILVQALGLESAPGERRYQDLARSLERLEVEEPDAPALIAAFLSIGDRAPLPDRSPQRLRDDTLSLICDLLAPAPGDRPVVLAVEDAQWLDPSSAELLSLLAARSASPLLLLLSHRTGVPLPWTPPEDSVSIPLGRMSRGEASALVTSVGGGAAFPDEVLDHILSRADGIPLFAEELTLGVLESGVLERAGQTYRVRSPIATLGVPPTLHDSLMARLDRLPEGKYVAQVAAVLGRTFSADLLRSIALVEEPALQRGIAELLGADLLRAGEGRGLSFKHALIQEIAYQSLLRNDRRKVHARAAAALAHDREIADREPELVAQHYAGAGEVAEAIAHWTRAAERALQHSAALEAIQHYSAALEVLKAHPQGAERDELELGLRLALGNAFITTQGYAAGPVEREFGRATDLCRSLQADAPRLFSAASGLWGYHLVKGDPEETERLVARQRDLATTSGAKSHLLMASHAAGVSAFYGGRFQEALPHLEEATRRYEEALEARRVRGDGRPFRNPATSAPLYLGWCQLLLGDLTRGLAQQERALEIAEHNLDAYVRVEAMTHLVASLHDRREPARALDLSDRIIAISEECGFRWWLGIGKSARGWVRAQLGDAAGGIAEIHEGLRIFREAGGNVPLVYRFSYLVDGYLAAGRYSDGLALIAEVSVQSRERLDRFFDAELERLRGELLLCAGAEHEPVEAAFRRALALAQRQSARWIELRCATSLARLMMRTGRPREAASVLRPRLAAVERNLGLPDLREAAALLVEADA